MWLCDFNEGLAIQIGHDLIDACPSRATAKAVLASLKSLCRFCPGGAVAERALRKAVIEKAAEDMKVDADETKFVTKGDLGLLLRQADTWAGKKPKQWVRWRALLYTAAFTGLRLGELRGLMWKHLDPNRGIIKVQQMATEKNEILPPKSKAGKREVPVATVTVNALRQWKLATKHGGDEDFVFGTGAGNVENHGNIHRRCYTPVQVAALGAKRYKFHALRHTAGSLLIESGIKDAKKIQTIMGHEDIQITFNVYGHMLNPVDDERKYADAAAAEVLGVRPAS